MKLKFYVDTYYKGELMFEAGKTYEVDEALGWAGRWVKRGAEIVVEQAPAIVPEEPKVEEVSHVAESDVEVELPSEKAETEAVPTRRGRKPKYRDL